MAAALAPGIYPLSKAESLAAVTPVSFLLPPGELYRYGTNVAPGTTDMTAAVNTWLSVGGSLTMSVPDVVLISGVLNMVSNTTLTIVQGATFKTNTPGLSVFKAAGKSSIVMRGGTIQQTVNSAAVHVGLIELAGCTKCTVEKVELIGAQWGGILLNGSSNCTVQENNIHDSLGVTLLNVDSHDISCYGASSFNTIRNNICYGGIAAEHGVMIQDPGGNQWPMKDLVDGNKIGPHSSYGVLDYLIDHTNTYCTIVNNEIEGITGTSQGGSTGCGIYVQGAGGTKVSSNTVRDCCKSTSNNSLTPAGIGLNLAAGLEACDVIGNSVLDMAQYYGIEVVTGRANIVGNTVDFSSAVSGTNTTAIGIYVNSASGVNLQGNQVNIDNSISNGEAIFVFANGVNISNINVGGNIVTASNLRGIRIDTSGAFTITNVTVNGNNVTGGGAASVPLQVANIIGGSITGNMCSATTVQALDVNGCTNTRLAGNVFTTTGALAVNIAGTCTGSYYDLSNAASTGIKNTGTGMICAQLASATPTTGFNSAVGDWIVQSVPVVGSPKGWRCTLAGNPGTWPSEGNL